MTERRRDPLTGEWVLYAPARGARPRPPRRRNDGTARPAHDPGCILCPGNEGALPGIVEALPAAEGGGWQTRAVPNKFPIMDDSGAGDGALHGRHEVIVESPRHDAAFATMPVAARARVLEAYRRRFAALMALPETRAVVLFRNDGEGAGASLQHAHAQVASLSEVPPAIARREGRMTRHLDEHGRCLVCDAIADERADGRRLVAQTDGFVAFVPFAARRDCECWIAPAAHAPRFDATGEAALADLALLLGDVLRRVADCTGAAPWNLVLHAPSRDLAAKAAHWWLQILPRPGPTGGFEAATALQICPSLPEDAAARLRAA
jgi:UDPglucose--hexose-1-phosphate uridylyltransferase